MLRFNKARGEQGQRDVFHVKARCHMQQQQPGVFPMSGRPGGPVAQPPMTGGGPGLASEVPAKFILDHLFQRGAIGLASAASVVMLVTVLALLAPYYFMRKHQAQGGKA